MGRRHLASGGRPISARPVSLAVAGAVDGLEAEHQANGHDSGGDGHGSPHPHRVVAIEHRAPTRAGGVTRPTATPTVAVSTSAEAGEAMAISAGASAADKPIPGPAGGDRAARGHEPAAA